jgi:hypothetical protein
MGGCIARVNRPLIKYRVGNVPNPQKKLNNINLLKKYKNLFTEKEYSKSLNKYYKMIGFGYLFVGNRKEAINYLSLINSRFGDSKPFFLTLLKVIPNFLFVIIHYLYLKINLFIK